MDLHILVPINVRKKLKENIFQSKDKNDKVTILDVRRSTEKYNEAIKNSNYNNFLIIHPSFEIPNENYISRIKKEVKNNNSYFLVYTDKLNDGKNFLPTKNCIVYFNSKCFGPIEKKYKDTILYLRHLTHWINERYKIHAICNEINETEKNEQISKGISKARNVPESIGHRVEKTKPKSKSKKKVDKSKPLGPSNIFSTYQSDSNKPTILLISDVKGWAWWIKSKYIATLLSDYYDFDLVNVVGQGRSRISKDIYDLYLTFGYSYINYLSKFPMKKRITGVTAHRPWAALKKRMNMAYTTHANSVLLYNELKQIHNFPFYVPNGVDTNLFYEKTSVMLDHDEPIFGHVGKKGKMKNQTTIIEPAIEKAKVNYYPHYNTYENRISHESMVDVHHNYDIFVAASDEDGTPNGMLEAAACGRPIIINNIGNAPEFVINGYNGFIVEKKIDAYVSIMEWLKNNPDKVYEMGQNAKKEIQKSWSWNLMSKNYKFMFDKILGIKRDWSEYENSALYHIKDYIK